MPGLTYTVGLNREAGTFYMEMPWTLRHMADDLMAITEKNRSEIHPPPDCLGMQFRDGVQVKTYRFSWLPVEGGDDLS